MPSRDHGVAAVLLDQLRVEEVHLRRADEAGHEQVGGMVKDLLGRADLLDEAVLHDGRSRSPRVMASVWFVGDIDKGGVDAVAELDDLGAHLVAELGVQGWDRGSSISNTLGAPRTMARPDGHALALAAGQGLGLPVQILGDVQDLGGLLHPAD